MIKTDIAIIGGGPAGLTAALYASRGGAKTVVFERLSVGGQAAITPDIQNFPAFKRVEGFDLGLKMAEHAEHFGAEIIYNEVTSVNLAEKTVTVGGDVYSCKAIILAMGASPRRLGLAQEQRLSGRGVSYCATCDGNFYKGKRVAVCGGGNTAVEDALYLADLAHEVFLIHRRDSFRAEQVLVDKLLSNPKITTVLNSVVVDIVGDKSVQSVVVGASGLGGSESARISGIGVESNGTSTLDVDALFVAVGNIPNSELVRDQLELKDGYIVVDAFQRTSVDGVYAAGDVSTTVLRQVVTACANGAVAATEALKHHE